MIAHVQGSRQAPVTAVLQAVTVLQAPVTERRMAEVLVEYSDPVTSKEGRTFIARACGAEFDDSRWQGWIEFEPVDGGPPIRSGRETTQPNRTDTVYWATGLTPVYLEGSLDRALNPLPRSTPSAPPPPSFAGPAPEMADQPPVRDSVLNPFSVYRKGESHLRNQLSAVSAWHLVNIIEAYGLSEQRRANLEATPEPVLVELIVSAVQKRALGQAPVGRP
jgi:hypothetical protein